MFCIIKRLLKQQWRSTASTISTKQTATSHLKSLNTKKTMNCSDEYPGPGLGQVQKYGRVKPVNKWGPS